MVLRHLQLLGPARIEQIDTTVNKTGDIPRFRSRRTMALLGYLVTAQRPLAREHLAVMFWLDEPVSKGRGNLRRELHNLSKILPDCWELDRQAVSFVPSAETTVDLYTLLELENEERWGEAAELLGGEFLEGLYLDDNLEFETWLLGERERWLGHSETILRRVIDGHTRRGHYMDALRYSRRLLQLLPWNEETHRQVMRLQTWTGQRGAALRQYESCKQALWEQLDVGPSEETTALYRQIQAGDVEMPPQLPAFLTQEEAKHAFDRPIFIAREHEMVKLEAFLEEALAGKGRVIFISGDAGRGKSALMESFILRAMEAHKDLLVASGKCNAYSGVGDPYLPFRDVIGMLTGDVEAKWDAGAISRDHARRLWTAFPLVGQALLEHAPQVIDILLPGEALLSRAMNIEQSNTAWLPRLQEQIKRQQMDPMNMDQSLLFQQVTNVLTATAEVKPLLLILDDMQWADTATVGLVFHMGRRLADIDSKLLIICAYRPEEVALEHAGERHPLAKTLNEFKRTFGDVWIDIDRIDAVESRQFVNTLLDTEPNNLTRGFRDALFNRTEGHPLFTVELMRAMQERGDLLKDKDGLWIEGLTLDWGILPARVEAVIAERIKRLNQEMQELLTIASVEGEMFTAQVAAEVQKMPERAMLQHLSQDLERRHRLVREQAEVETDWGRMSRYRFGHVLFQEYLYKRLSQGERRLLHGEVAATLEKLYEGKLDEMAVQLAHHYYEAEDYEHAFQYFTLAAERAAQIYANDEAIRHYTQAIEVAEKISPDIVTLTNLYRGRGLAYEMQGDFDRACCDHEVNLQISRAAGEQQVEWRTQLDLGKLWASRDYNQTRDYFEAALELARQMDDPAILAGSLNWMGNWNANAENPFEAVMYHKEALKIFEALGDQRHLANTLDFLGIVHLLSGDLTASSNYYDRAIAHFRELDDLPRLASSLMGRATIVSLLILLTSVPAATPPEARRDFDEAMQIAQEIASLPGEAWAHWSLGLLNTVQGHFGTAREVMQNGLRIASEIGHREWAVGNRFALGVWYGELFTPEKAREQFEEALRLARELQSQYWINHAIGGLASVYILCADLEQAQTCLEMVISPKTPMDTMGKRYCWARQAELALAQGEPAETLEIVERLIETAPGIEPGRVITFLWQLKGDALAALGQTEEAHALLCAAIENAQANEERFLLWRIHASLGRLYEATGQQTESQSEISAASELINQLADSIDDEVLRDNFLEGANSEIIKPTYGM